MPHSFCGDMLHAYGRQTCSMSAGPSFTSAIQQTLPGLSRWRPYQRIHQSPSLSSTVSGQLYVSCSRWGWPMSSGTLLSQGLSHAPTLPCWHLQHVHQAWLRGRDLLLEKLGGAQPLLDWAGPELTRSRGHWRTPWLGVSFYSCPHSFLTQVKAQD